jgi:hypothetical protein
MTLLVRIQAPYPRKISRKYATKKVGRVWIIFEDLRWNSSSRCTLDSVHYIGQCVPTSEYPYGRGEMGLTIKNEKLALENLSHMTLYKTFVEIIGNPARSCSAH